MINSLIIQLIVIIHTIIHINKCADLDLAIVSTLWSAYILASRACISCQYCCNAGVREEYPGHVHDSEKQTSHHRHTTCHQLANLAPVPELVLLSLAKITSAVSASDILLIVSWRKPQQLTLHLSETPTAQHVCKQAYAELLRAGSIVVFT